MGRPLVRNSDLIIYLLDPWKYVMDWREKNPYYPMRKIAEETKIPWSTLRDAFHKGRDAKPSYPVLRACVAFCAEKNELVR